MDILDDMGVSKLSKKKKTAPLIKLYLLQNWYSSSSPGC